MTNALSFGLYPKGYNDNALAAGLKFPVAKINGTVAYVSYWDSKSFKNINIHPREFMLRDRVVPEKLATAFENRAASFGLM